MAGDGEHEGEKADTPPPKSGPRRALEMLLWFAKDQWFLIGIAVVTVIASQVQVPMAQQNIKQVLVSYLSGMFSPNTAGT
jgi:solute carrier family 10 (sodium/bile acid cotransporter), member 7